jgi:glyoxylase-like metal-dependent hydrolase (beta-lactamase superfamily II)
VTRPEVVPIRLAYNRLYAVRSDDGWVLIDAGPAYRGAFEELAAQLAAAGIEQSDVTCVVVSHGHLDHAGLATEWQHVGVPVAVHGDDAETVSRPPLQDPREAAALVRFLHEAGLEESAVRFARRWLDERRRQALKAALAPADDPEFSAPQQGNWPFRLRMPAFTADLLLEDGQEPAPGIEVFHAPGHTPGNCVFRAGDAVFSGDQLVPGITPVPAVQFLPPDYTERLRSLPLFIRGLELIRELKPAVVYPGHGEPILDAVAQIDRQLAQVEKRCQRIFAELSSGPLTTLEVARRLYPHLPSARLWQVLAVVTGHLDVLHERGRAQLVDGRWRRL